MWSLILIYLIVQLVTLILISIFLKGAGGV